MLDPELLNDLCCPETRQKLRLADPALIVRLNQRIAAGDLKNRGGPQVSEPMDAGLIREDGKFLYPVRGDIPVMLVEEAIALEG